MNLVKAIAGLVLVPALATAGYGAQGSCRYIQVGDDKPVLTCGSGLPGHEEEGVDYSSADPSGHGISSEILNGPLRACWRMVKGVWLRRDSSLLRRLKRLKIVREYGFILEQLGEHVDRWDSRTRKARKWHNFIYLACLGVEKGGG